MTRVEMKRAALDFANELRAIQGAEPAARLLKGADHDTGACPIARTATVEGSGVSWCIGPKAAGFGPKGGQRYCRETPAGAREFMAAFDAGEFPNLHESREAVPA